MVLVSLILGLLIIPAIEALQEREFIKKLKETGPQKNRLQMIDQKESLSILC